MFGQRRTMVLVTAAMVLLAAGVIYGSGASFVVTSAPSVGNTFTAGELVATDSGAKIIVEGLAPGHEKYAGVMGVQNDGDVSGTFGLGASDVTVNALADVLNVRIIGFDGTTEVYDGLLKDLTPAGCNCGSLAPGVSGEVEVYASFPDGGYGADNPLMLMAVSATLTWTAVSD
jgi:hypothetical protein